MGLFRKFAFAAATAALSFVTGSALAAPVVLNASATAAVAANSADSTCANGDCNGGFLTVNYSDAAFNYGLIQFDLTGVSGAYDHAIIALEHRFNQQEATFGLFQVLEAWDPNTVTYNTRPLLAAAPVDTIYLHPLNTGPDIHYAEITSLANAWLSGAADNYGLALMRIDGDNPFIYWSAVGDHAPRLFLDQERGLVPEPGTWALMILGFGAAGAGLRRARSVRFV